MYGMLKRSVQSIKEKVQRIQGAKGYANWVSDMAVNEVQATSQRFQKKQ